jgi:hypothetical protein
MFGPDWKESHNMLGRDGPVEIRDQQLWPSLNLSGDSYIICSCIIRPCLSFDLPPAVPAPNVPCPILTPNKHDSTYAVSRPSFSINDGSTKRSTLNLVVSRRVLVAGEWVVLELSQHRTGQRL